MKYDRITPLSSDFSDAEAISVESLRDAWVEQRSGLAESGALSLFNERLIRRWSIETGIIERLYSLDRGTTEILIANGLNASLIEHGSTNVDPVELIEILSDHEAAAGYVVDYVSQKRGITTSFIKSVHALLVRHQDFIEVEDTAGKRFTTELLKGTWKHLPNNPRRTDGSMHEYCPPIMVAEEMENLIKFYNEAERMNVPSVIKAAWLHHRFTQIHPFQDGNGRAARALAAYVFVADDCFPIVIERETRETYISALENADLGDLKPLVRLFGLLEKKELEEALSLSELTLAEVQSRPAEGGMREKLLAALRDRARDKRESITAKRRSVILKGEKIFSELLDHKVDQLVEELSHVLLVELPGSRVTKEISDSHSRHYFKSQIVSLANEENYFCDLDTFHRWVRIRMERPNEIDRALSEIVVSMHSLGRQFTGVLAISAYFANRFLDEDNRSVTLFPKRLSKRAMTFSYLEGEDNIQERVDEWVEGVFNLGLAELQSTI